MICVLKDNEEIGMIDLESGEVHTEDDVLDNLAYELLDEGVPLEVRSGTVSLQEADEENVRAYLRKQGYETQSDSEPIETTDCDEQKKLTHKEVRYEEAAKGKDQCKACAHYHASTPDANEDENQSCQIVQSPVMPDGWCKEFKRATRDASTPDVYPREPALELDGIDFQGLPIAIENLRGSTRHGASHHTRLTAPYGYIKGTSGADSDPVDVFVGSVATAPYAFVIHTKDPSTGNYDEDKVVLGVESAREAKSLFDENYDRPGFFESMEKMTVPQLKEKLRTLRGRKLTA